MASTGPISRSKYRTLARMHPMTKEQIETSLASMGHEKIETTLNNYGHLIERKEAETEVRQGMLASMRGISCGKSVARLPEAAE